MYKKQEPFLFVCMECGEEVHPKMTKCCQRCSKILCWTCVKTIEPYVSPDSRFRLRPPSFKPFNHPACPKCYDEIERENEEKEAEYVKRQEEIYGTEEERSRREEDLYGDYEGD